MHRNNLLEETGKKLRQCAKQTVFGNRLQTPKHDKKNKLIAVILTSALSLSILSGCPKSDSATEYGTFSPSMRLPKSSIEQAFPSITASPMLSLSTNYYKGIDTTTKDLEELEQEIRRQFEWNRIHQKAFELPDGFKVHVTEERNPLFTLANSPEEYDKQIYDAKIKLDDLSGDAAVFQYYRIGITALNCLDLLSNNDATKAALSTNEWKELKFYYAELAYWGFANYYVFGSLSEATESDLYYRCGQIFDHLTTAAAVDEKEPPHYYEMCLVAAAFLGMAFQILETNHFQEIGSEYHSDVWDLEHTMLKRLTSYTKSGSGFSELMEAHASAVPS